MKPLSWLLWLFPYAFVRDYGAAWESATEEMWSQAKTSSSRWRLALQIILDSAKSAPVAHWQTMKQAVLGPVPQLVATRSAPWKVVAAWCRHAKGGKEETRQFLFCLLVGALLFVMLYLWLYDRSLDHSVAFMASVYPDANLTREGLLTSSIWFWCALLPLACFSAKRIWTFLRHRQGPVLRNGFALALGFYLSLHLLLLATLPGIANRAMETFVRFPQTRDLVAPRPRSPDASEWTPTQKEWFDPSTGHVKESKLATWCATRLGWSASEYQMLMSLPLHDVGIRALLWAGEEAILAIEGCQTSDELFKKQAALAHRSRVPHGTDQMIWMMLSRISLTHDHLSSAHFIVWPRMHANVIKACGVIQGELLAQRKMPAGVGGDEELCMDLHRQYGAQGSTPLGSLAGPIDESGLPPRWMWGENLRIAIDGGNNARILGENDFALLRHEIAKRLDAPR